MFMNRIALLLVIALISLWQPVASQTRESGKFRVELNNGERFALTSVSLTSDRLTGVKRGDTISFPTLTVHSLDRYVGRGYNTGAVIGAAVVVTCALVATLKIDSDASALLRAKEDDSNIAPEVFGYVAGGTLLGIAIGAAFEKWESVPVSGSFGYQPDAGALRFQISLAF